MIDRSKTLACVLAMMLAALAGGLARAQTLTALADTTSPAEQFYLLSFTDEPIIEVAEAVVGGAVSRELAIDPAIDGMMSFSAEGRFTPDTLLQEFGTAALDQDVALIQTRSGDLSLILRANMTAELANGARLVALTVPTESLPAQLMPQAATPVLYNQARWWEGPVGGMLIFLTGAACGTGALYASQRILRPAGPPTSERVRITHQVLPPVETAEGSNDDELVIPRFENRLQANTEPRPKEPSLRS